MKVTRREFIGQALALGAASLSLPALAAPKARQRRPNVLFILGDDHRHDWMHHKGKDFLETPHLDRLAREGWSFPNAFGCAGVCSPARASLLTGKYPHQASAPSIVWQNNSFLRGQTMFPQLLHRAGYQTGYVGKFHLGEEEKPKSGFDLWASFPFVGAYFDQPLWVNGKRQSEKGYIDDNLAEFAAATLRRWAKSDRPFSMTVGLKAPHIPFMYPPRMAKRYANVIFPTPATFDQDPALTRPGLYKNALKARKWPSAIPAYGSFQEWLRAYTRCAMTIDESVGRLLAALDESGAAEDTLVIYTSDQGYSLGELGLCEKHYAYEQVMRVPMIVRFPRPVRPGSPPSDLVSHLDVAATILDLCVGQVPATLRGESWRKLLEAESPERPALRTEVFFDFSHPRDDFLPAMQAVRTARYKLIDYEYQPQQELYDLVEDPNEAVNRIGDPSLAGVRADLAGRLAHWKRETEWAPRIQAPIVSVYLAGPLSQQEDARQGASLCAVKFAALVNGKSTGWRRLASAGGDFELKESLASKRPAIVYVAIALERLGAEDPFIAIQLAGQHPAGPIVPLAFAGFLGGERIWMNEAYASAEGQLPEERPVANSGYNPPLAAGQNVVVLRVLVANDTPSAWWISAFGAIEKIQWW